MTTTERTNQTTVVLGGTGRTGRRVAAGLRERGLDVRIGSRRANPPFDWSDDGSWDRVLDGSHAVYAAYAPDLAVPGAAEVVARLATRARAAGVQRFVLLSGRGEDAALAAEDATLSAFPDATVVRASWFAQNFTEGEFAQALAGGALALPVGAAVREPFIDAADIADVALAALTTAGHRGRRYELTGPELLTFPAVVAEIAAVTGRPMRFLEISAADATARWRSQGLPEDVIGLLRFLFGEVLDGRNASLCDGVQQALGRAPRPIVGHLRAAADAGAWS